MKKLWLIPFILFIQTSEAKQNPHDFNGFYVKGGLGASQPVFDNDRNLAYIASSGGVSVAFSAPLTREYTVSSFAGMLGFGYSYQVNKLWVLSAEFASQFTQAENEFESGFNLTGTSLLGKSTTELKNDFSLLIKPGIITQGKTQFYLLMGPRWGNFESSIESDFLSTAFVPAIDDTSSTSASGYSLGFTVGLGVERLIDDGFSIALEYSYTSYGDIPSLSGETEVLNLGGTSYSVAYEDTSQSSVNTLMVDLIYRF